MAAADRCFHCALPVTPDVRLTVEIDGKALPVCCPGCKAVAELIRDTGLSRYYELRDAPDPGVGRPPDEAIEWRVFDSDEMLDAFTTRHDGEREATVYVGGMYCSACSWLIETTLGRQAGVRSAEVNPITHRLRLRFPDGEATLSACLATLARLGYQPQPLSPDSRTRPEVTEQRTALKRLLVASLGMMQAMMFAVGLYAMDFQGIDADMQHFLRLVSFLVTTPVVFYAARPFFTSAWRGLVARKPGMDLPVSIAVGAAYAASVYATFTRGPAGWFDSVAKVVFFLTLGRFLEMRARHRSIDRSVALSSVLPNTATRVRGERHEVVPVSQLAAGDTVLIRAGDPIPADGLLRAGTTSVDEAMLTGEPTPQVRVVGDELAAGSVNLDGLIEMTVTRTGNDTTLGTISRLSERARYARPTFVTLADRIASVIVVALLVVAVAVAVYWSIADADRAFVITLSVLVVTCPCALALATPAAFAAAGSRLAQLRLLVEGVADMLPPGAYSRVAVLDGMSQTSHDLAAVTQQSRLVEVLKQGQYTPLAAEKQVLIIYAVSVGELDDLEIEHCRAYEQGLYQFFDGRHKDLLEQLAAKGGLTDELKKAVNGALKEYKAEFQATHVAA